MDYTTRWNNFQFKSPTYVDEHEEPNQFSLVYWEQHDPVEVTVWKTGEKKISTESCIVIGTLTWEPQDEYFEFKSCGLRYLEYATPELNRWILAFANMKAIELKNKFNYYD